MKNPKKTYLSCLVILLVSLFSTSGQADRIGFSDEEWKTLHTEHFDVVYTAKQQDLGLYYANQAEKAWANLATVFINKPIGRIVLIVNDTTDISNGYATLIPYAHIMAYSVPIGSQESLSEAGDWGRELITHELTHIMQLEPSLGAYRYIRPIFGTIVAPNLLMPVWWKEGMAVEMETRFSPRGRSRSKFQDASVRAFVLDNKLFTYTLPQVNEMLPSWPYGSRPYLFGSLFWGSLVDDAGLEGVNQLVSRQAERVPYMVEQPMQELVHRNYEAQYTKALQAAEENGQTQLQTLSRQPLSTPRPIKLRGQSSSSPAWSEEFKMLAFIEHIEDKAEIALLNEKGQRFLLENRPKGSLSGLDFQPHMQKILYVKVDDLNSKYMVSDLYLYDILKKKSERLTTNQRAREASFAEDGQKIIFVSTENGRTQIKTFDLATKKVETILSSTFQERYQSPIFWNSDVILFSKLNETGTQKIYSYNLPSRREAILPFPLEGLRFPRKKKWNGADALFFTSSQNGVNNVYVSTDLQTATPVSHVPVGIWSFDIDPVRQTIWSTNMTSDGFRVAAVDLKKRAALPVIENKLAARYPTSMPATAPDKNYASDDYAASSYLLPTYWIPYVASSGSSRGVYVSAQTAGHDPINVHQYSLQASYDTDLQRGGFLGFYTNSATSLPFELSAIVHNQALGNLSNIVETKTGALGFIPDIFKINKHLLFEFGAQYQQTHYFSAETRHWGPFLLGQYLDYSQNLFQISPEKGWGAYLKYERFQNLKDSRDYNKVMGSIVGYYSPWLPAHHTFMTRLSTLLTFETVPSRFGTSNDSLFVNSDLMIPQFVLRGYAPSQFYGRSLWNTNVEYRFPLHTLNAGIGTDPYFLKRLSAAVIVDGMGVEGGSVTEKNVIEKRSLNESFWSSGLEFKLETTIGYVLPMNFVLGAYIPHSPIYSGSPQIGVSFQIGGF